MADTARGVVLVVDQPDGALPRVLRSMGLGPLSVHPTLSAAVASAGAARVAVVCRAALGPASLETVRALAAARRNLPIVVAADAPAVPEVVALVKAGATDVVAPTPEGLQSVLALIAEHAEAPPSAPATEDWAPAASEVMIRVQQQAEEAARLAVPVLLTGEVGVGKQRLARLIHERSVRAGRPFERVNCAALPGDLLERELFGEDGGPPGRLEAADGGTCLIAEIGQAPPGLQARLGHLLTEGRTYRAGGRTTFSLDVRVIATTSHDPRVLLQAGTLRRDLYDAFAMHIYVPPLRQRPADVPLLLDHFLTVFRARFGRPEPPLGAATRQLLLDYTWPGNVQELESVIKRFVVLGDERELGEEIEARRRLVAARHDALAIGPPAPGPRAVLEAGLRAVAREAARQAERAAIRQVLERVNWNRAEAARRLKISYKTLLSKLERDELGPPRDRRPTRPGTNAPRPRPRRP
ncbi:MAG TPA: sigma 54-interacting transcriptional regulator [Candidatus Binatia bacterium]|nr:sigma 54-interacting transcriptional regulator [Candidatus Binatia bacterium]